MEIMASLLDIYNQHNDLKKGKSVVSEKEKQEDEYSTARETVREYLDARRDNRSSEASRILSIDMLRKKNISIKMETQQKQTLSEIRNETINIEYFGSIEIDKLSLCRTTLSTDDDCLHNNMSIEQTRTKCSH